MHPLKRKITKEQANTIGRILAERKYTGIIKQARKDVHQVSVLIYNQIYAGKLKALAEVPEGWLPSSTSQSINLVGTEGKSVSISLARIDWSYNGNVKSIQTKSQIVLSFPKALVIPYCDQLQKVSVQYDDPNVSRFAELQEHIVDTQLEEQDFKDQMVNTVLAHGTWFKLYEAWSEVRELISHLEPQETPKMLPAIGSLSSLNAELGLPSKTA